ncbi:MAG: MarR family transcriptional regulator [Acidobacteriota bacterium]
MVSTLRNQIRQRRPFASPSEETFLNLQRTANLLQQSVTRLLRQRADGLTPSQYNVLRILRGASPEALTCGDIAERLVTPGPDVTRLLDRLEKRELVARERSDGDRRVVRSHITDAGLHLLAELDAPMLGWLEQHLGHLSDDHHRQLSRLLERAREAVD